MSENISEMLKAAVEAGDLRRKETLRLIEAAEKVGAKICDAAKESGLLVKIEKDRIAICIERNPNLYVQGTAIVVYELPRDLDREYIYPSHIWDIERAESYVIAADSQATEPHAYIRNGKRVVLSYINRQPYIYTDGKEEKASEEEVKELKKHPAPAVLDTMPRRLWVKVVPLLIELAQKLASESDRLAKETTAAADLAEKLAAAIG